MDRLASIDVPAFPLQLALRRHPEWKREAAVVVDCDKPQGRILWVNEKARAARILPGLRYASALSLCGTLRAAVVPDSEIAAAVDAVVEELQRFTPLVESAGDDPGVFWLDPSGLGRHYESVCEWGRLIRLHLRRVELLEAVVVVGFGRFATVALAKAAPAWSERWCDADAATRQNIKMEDGLLAFREPGDERRALADVPLELLRLAPRVRDVLAKLGVKTVGEFLALPAGGIEKRFGEDVWQLYREASGEHALPLEPRPVRVPLERTLHLDDPEIDSTRLTALVGRLLEALLEKLAEHGEVLRALVLELVFDRGGRHEERLQPAAPTSDWAQLVELVRLRLESRRWYDGVVDVTLRVEGARASSLQLELFAVKPERDLGAANRALARLRAELGEAAVVRARLCERHLPEGRFSWEPLAELTEARPRAVATGTLVRRIYTPPIVLPARPRHEPDGWMLRGLEQGPVVRVLGPYVVAGGWWKRLVQREYHFAETQKGEVLWVYYDRLRRRWSLQGRVE